MGVFELPANIKQIGSISEGLRIYMEDYVYSYLQQYAAAGGYDEKLALLIGRCLVIDGQQILFISGAVQGRYIKIENGMSAFTQRSMDYAGDMIKKYFKGMEIVGWVQSQPSYGVFLNTAYAEYHVNVFKEDHQVLFVIDPIEKVSSFYAYGMASPNGTAVMIDNRDLTETTGYFIYYEKNHGMHEYMLENKAEQELTVVLPTEADEAEEITEEEETVDSEYAPETLIRNRQSVRSLKKATTEQRRLLNLLVTLSAVLFIICFIMGAGLVQNRDRISNMESQLTQLSTSYRDLLVDLRDNTASVFAADSDSESVKLPSGDGVDAADTQKGQAVLIQEDGIANLENIALAQTDASIVTPEPTLEPTAIPTPEPTQAVVQAAEVSARVIPDTYVVQQGDNLTYISKKFYGTSDMVDRIIEINGMTDDKIYYGKVLKLPK